MRIIKTKLDARHTASYWKLLQKIIVPWCRILNVPFIDLGRPHGKSFVMLSRDNNVYHSSIFGDLYPIIGIESLLD
nr:hypothetical protein [Arcticibacter svalbardensis]